MHGAIRDPQELLDVSVNLYSAMYKYGKQAKSTVQTKRVDREASIAPMRQKGEIISNFSTSLQPEFDMLFSKSNMILIETEILPGAVCADFQRIFDSVNAVYNMNTEEEVLIAPFSPIEIESLELSEEEKEMRDIDMNPPVGKYRVVVKPPEKAQPLTEKEQKHKERMQKIFEDPFIQDQAASFLDTLQAICENNRGISKEQALKYFSQNEIQTYIQWKEAFQSVLRYRTREIALEIERGIEEAESAKNQMFMSQDTDETLLTQLDDMAQTRTLTGLNSGISKTKKEVSKETDPKDNIKAK